MVLDTSACTCAAVKEPTALILTASASRLEEEEEPLVLKPSRRGCEAVTSVVQYVRTVLVISSHCDGEEEVKLGHAGIVMTSRQLTWLFEEEDRCEK